MISKILAAFVMMGVAVMASGSSHYTGAPQAHNDPDSLLGDVAPMGSSPYYPMRFIFPLSDSYEYMQLEIWNSVEGRYLEDQDWTFHGRLIAEYEKKSGVTYKAGVCFVMDPPY